MARWLVERPVATALGVMCWSEALKRFALWPVVEMPVSRMWFGVATVAVPVVVGIGVGGLAALGTRVTGERPAWFLGALCCGLVDASSTYGWPHDAWVVAAWVSGVAMWIVGSGLAVWGIRWVETVMEDDADALG